MTANPTETMPTAEQREEAEQREDSAPLRLRYRIRFAKTGLLRWTSHRDLATLWERLVRRAQLKLSMSEGFHPKPRIGFVSALALGINGENEVVELDLAERLSAGELLRRLVQDDQPGLQIKSVQLLPEGSGKAKLVHTEYVITTPDPELGAPPVDVSAVRSAIESLLGQESVTVERKKKPLTVSVAEQILQLDFSEERDGAGAIELTLAASDGATLKPTDVLELIHCSDWVPNGSQINRTEVVLQREFETTDPECYATANQPPHTPAGSPKEVS
ncbi:MAG: TIGR03936 family radical SAM-associated protein [Planctomycetota bacterium]